MNSLHIVGRGAFGLNGAQMQKALDEFQSLPPIEPREMIGLWSGRGIPSGHPFDGELENLGWFGKRFTPDMRGCAAVSLRRAATDPDRPGENTAAPCSAFPHAREDVCRAELVSYLQRGFRARGPVASLKTMSFQGVVSAAMVYDDQPIVDHFRKIDERRIMGAMTIQADDRIYFFELLTRAVCSATGARLAFDKSHCA